MGAPAWTFGTIDAGDKSAAIFVLDQISPSAEISFGNDTLISIEHIKLTDVDDVVRLDVIEGAQFAGSDGKGGVAEIKMEGNATGFGKGDLIDASLNSTNLSIDLAATSSNVKARDDSSGDKSLTILGAERVWGGSGDDIIKGNEKDNEIKGGGGTDTVNYGDGTVPITISYSSFGDDALISVADGLGGTDQLSEIEKIIGSSGNDIFSFEGLIPTNSNLTIDGGGGLHDKISLEEAVNAGGMKLVITDKGSGDGYIMNRNGADGVIYVKNFHTDIVGSDYSDIISDESSGDHTIDAGDGDDNITVGGSGATVDGGAGNDVILLKSASATIKFGGGGGHDVVNFDDVDGAYDLALQGLNPDDVELIAGGRNVYANFSGGEDGNGFHVQFIAVRIISTGDTITFLENGKNIGPNGNGSSISYGVDSRKLDSISFADGTVWTREGDDVYFSLGSWVTQDFWGYKHEYPGVDRPLYHTPDSYVDYVNTTYLQADPIGAPPPPPDQNHPGTSGDDDLKPGRGNDTVEGSAGNDRVRESRGDDTYKWNVGDGDDIIWGAGALDGFNTLELGAGILPTDLQFAVSDYGAGLTITFAGKTGSVTLSGALVGDGFGVDQIRFADNTILSRADLIAAASSEIAAAQTFENGTSSSDFIYAPAGNFVIDAGEGDDFISVEGAGAGTFLFSSADGHDQISDYGFGYSRNDTLVLTDANAADITLSRSGDSLLLTINSTGATVDITSQFTDDDGDIHGINTLKFADNTTWTRLQIRDAALGTESGTSPIAEAATAAVVEDGAIIRGTLVASDADDGDVLTFSLDNQIAGLALAANGNWSFDATNAAYQHLSQGEELILTVNYHVTDAAGLTSASTLTLTLTGTSTMPLVEQELINQRLADNAAFAYDVTGSFSDPEGDPLVFTAQLANGSELPTWLTFEDGQFEGTAPIGTSGVLNVVVTAANGVLETSSAFRLHFGPDNEAPAVSAPLPDIMGGVDDSLDISVSSFIDPDGDLVAVSAALADDSPLPTWLSLENGRLIGTPPVTAFGNTYAIKITATDGEDEGGAQFSITIGRRIVTGTSGDDEFELSTLFDVTGGQGRDRYGVVGNGEGVFYYSRGDGWDGLYSLDEGVRADKLIFTDISSDELSLYRYEDSAIFFVDDSNDFWGGNQFSGDNPGGVNQGFEHVQFSDSVTWDRDEIRNRANAPEIILDISDPSETGSSVSEAFVMESGLGAGTIDDFEVAGANHDYLQFDRSQFDSWAHLLGATTQQGSDLLIDLGGGDSVTLTDVSISAFTSLNVRFFGSASV
ncbi:hypothetical protein ASE06_16370 [Sphingopyxis sp. Root214]|nr:hypothetical protein ASD73_14025 [Sphingopyxis sp. Root154]KRC08029.1 hypothetical protein ASE06_16370 [Sphingopyxis sp. Root214]